MASKQRLTSLILTFVLLGLNLAALNYLIAGWSGARVDLTEEGVFSISPATRRILTTLDEDLTIYGYFSQRTHPKLSPLVPEISDLLDEYRAVSRGRVQVEIIDPGEDEAAEEEAADRFGVQSTPFQLASKYETGIVNAYFALVVRYGDQYERYNFQQLIEVEPLPDGDIDVKLRNLEYDLTRAIKKVVFGFRGSNELFERVEDPIRLTAIVSPDLLPEFLTEVPEALRKAAAELGEKGGDKFVYEEVDPTTDEARLLQLESRFGQIPPMAASFFGEESFYLYGILEIGGRLEQIVLTGESVSAATIREAVEDSLRRHTPGFLKTVGIVTPDPPDIPPQVRMQLQMPPQPPPEFDTVKRFLEQDYQIADVSLDSAGVPTDVDVLLVLKPTQLSEQQLYALDQYLMRGGRVIVCAGNYSAEYTASGLNVAPFETGLDDWLAHHGVTLGKTMVLDDVNQAMPIPEVRYTSLGAMRTISMVPYPYLVHVQDKGFLNRDITATLDSVGIYWGSPLTVDEAAAGELEVLPILQSSERSWTSDDLGRVAELEYFVPEEGLERQLLAVALAGRFESYYKDNPVPGAEDYAQSNPLAAPSDDESDTTAPKLPPVPLEQSPDTRLVVVGNAAFVSDFVASALGQVDGGFFVENLRFVENVIDWSTLDNDMMGIRSRGLVSRRLDTIEKSSEVTIEAINYVLPVVALIGLGLFLNYRRRQAGQEFFGDDPTTDSGRRVGGEAMNRSHKLLLGLLAIQLLLIFLVRSPFSSASGSVSLHPLLPALEAFTPARVELSGSDDAKVTLVRHGEGWGLEELGGFPADDTKVGDLLDKLRGLEVRRPVVSSSRYHDTFKVADDENEGRVKLFGDDSDDAKVDLLLGTSSNYRALHVRTAGQDPVYEVRDLAAYDVRAEPGNWADKEFVEVPEAELVGVVIENASGSFELIHGSDGWTAAGSDLVLDQGKVSTLLRAAASIRLAEPLGPVGEAGAEPAQPALTVTLRWQPGGPAAGAEEPPTLSVPRQELVYWIGDKLADPETQRYATRAGFEFRGAVWDSSVSSLIEQKLEGLAPGEAGGS